MTNHRETAPHAADHPGDDPLIDLLSLCARWLVQDPDPRAFIERLALEGPVRFPELMQDDGQPGTPRHDASQEARRRVDMGRFFRSFGWAVASSMPLPANDFRPRKLPLPGRNDACLCGSLRKYKHCCADMVPLFPLLENDLLGALVIEALPRKEWAALPRSRVALGMVATAAQFMCDDDRADDAARLLQGWAELPPPWPDARAELLDMLGDIYLDLGKPRKRKQLALAMVEHGGPAVQSKGWQRLCLLATDAGDEAAANRAFEATRRLTPDDPNVAILEVTTLTGRGLLERARERAGFHAKRLAQLPQALQMAETIAALEELSRAESPLGLQMRQVGDILAPERVLAVLDAWLAGLPEPKLRLALPASSVDDLGALRPTPAARKALERWHAAFRFTAPLMAWDSVGDDAQAVLDVDDWMPVLRAHPLLADCFEVLDGLVLALDALPLLRTLDTRAALLGRAARLWAQLRARQPRALCEWGHLDNRPALRLLVQPIEFDRSLNAKDSFDSLRHLIEVLNPNDNHGLRERLAAVYLRRGDLARALALCERYPDDGIGMRLLHARTLLALQRLDEAAALVGDALHANPHLRKLLLAARAPRLPDVPSYAVGSANEAKIVLAPQFDLWRADPAVRNWLMRSIGAAEPGGAPMADLFDPGPEAPAA